MYNYMNEDNKHHASSIEKGSCKPSVNVAQQFTCEDVTTYLNELRLTQSEKYDALVNIMKDFKCLRIDYAGVIGWVNALLKENPDLNQKFTRLFPSSNEIVSNTKKEPLPEIVIIYDKALGLSRSIMEFFHGSGNQDVLKSFMDSLGLFLKGKNTLIEVFKEVTLLFKDNPDLVKKLCTFLHVSYEEINLRDDDLYLNPVPTALNYMMEVKAAFPFEEEKYYRFIGVLIDYMSKRVDPAGVADRVKEIFKGHPNLILGFNMYLPQGYELPLTDEEVASQKMTVGFKEAICFVNKIKKRFKGHSRVYKSFLHILNMYLKQRKSIDEVYQEVATLFEDHPDLLNVFTTFLPYTSATPSVQPSSEKRKSGFGGLSSMVVCDDKDSLNGIFNEVTFLEKVKERLQYADDYKAFLECLVIYSREIVSRNELQILVADFLGKYPDLMEGFNELLGRSERADGFLASVMGKKPLWNDQCYETASLDLISLLVSAAIQVQSYNFFGFMLSKLM